MDSLDVEDMKIKFEGGNQIDANTLINTLIHYGTLVNQINNLYGDGSKKIEIKINALEKGSFEIDISLITNIISSLFSTKSVCYAAAISTITTTILGLYKKNKGKPVKEDEETPNIKIGEIKIDSITINNIYNNKDVRTSISKSIETAGLDEAVEGMQIGSGDNTVTLNKEDIETLVYDDFVKEDPSSDVSIEIVDNAVLNIVALSFDPRRKWTFLYRGDKISSYIKDPAFIKAINNGVRFAKGDSIIAKLEVIKEFNPEYNAFQVKERRIIQFIEHVKRNEQTEIEIK